MHCTQARMHRSENIKKLIPICRRTKMYWVKVKFVIKQYKPQELLEYEIVDEACQLQN